MYHFFCHFDSHLDRSRMYDIVVFQLMDIWHEKDNDSLEIESGQGRNICVLIRRIEYFSVWKQNMQNFPFLTYVNYVNHDRSQLWWLTTSTRCMSYCYIFGIRMHLKNPWDHLSNHIRSLIWKQHKTIHVKINVIGINHWDKSLHDVNCVTCNKF